MPELDFSYASYSRAYSMLRSSANQNGVIPLSEILAYTDHFGIIGTKEEFVDIIRSLELEEFDYHKLKNGDKDEDSEQAKLNKKKR